MKNFIMMAAAATLLSTSAFAQVTTTLSPGAHDITANTANGGAGGSVLASGNSNNTNLVAPVIAPVTTWDNADINVNDLSNRNTNGQQQDAHNQQGQNQSTSSSATGGAGGSVSGVTTSSSANTGASTANNAGNAQTTNVDASTHQVRQVAMAYAPPIVNNMPCAIGGAAGLQTESFGVSLGGAKVNKACDARAMAQILFQIGEREAAVQYLSAFDPKVSAAVTAARTAH